MLYYAHNFSEWIGPMSLIHILRLNRYHPRDLLFLVHLGPFLTIVLQSAMTIEPIDADLAIRPMWSLAVGLWVSLLSVLQLSSKRLPKYGIGAAIIIWLALLLNHLSLYPSRFMFAAIFAFFCFAVLSSVGFMRGGLKTLPGHTANPKARGRYQASGLLDVWRRLVFYSSNYSILIGIAVFFFGFAEESVGYSSVIYSAGVTALLILARLVSSDLKPLKVICAVALLVATCIALMNYLSEARLQTLSLFLWGLTFFNYFIPAVRGQLRQRFQHYLESLFRHPEGAVIFYFMVLCFIGTLLLYSPVSAAGEQRFSLVDAAFTAISAVCVTGLTVLSTASDFSFWGQLFIIILIELGGLGIMTLSSLLVLVVGRRLSISHEEALSGSIGSNLRGEARHMVRQVLWVTLVCEGLGALILTASFYQFGEPFHQALWKGVFTAISAFCNAGFALNDLSLITYAESPMVLHTVGVLIMLGSLSPAIVVALPRIIKGQNQSLQSKIVVLSNVFLWLAGAFFILILEWRHSMVNLGLLDKFHNAFFESITARTAGFNALDPGHLQPATIFLLIFLMFIGGSPGGTAGGIKTTTFMILMYTVLSVGRGYEKVQAFSRYIPQKTIYRATTVAIGGLLTGFVGLLALLTTQRLGAMEALFEVVSALGTVGMSLGATGKLDQIGKVVVMLLMFLGRVGPLSVVLFLGKKTEPTLQWKLSKEDVSVA